MSGITGPDAARIAMLRERVEKFEASARIAMLRERVEKFEARKHGKPQLLGVASELGDHDSEPADKRDSGVEGTTGCIDPFGQLEGVSLDRRERDYLHLVHEGLKAIHQIVNVITQVAHVSPSVVGSTAATVDASTGTVGDATGSDDPPSGEPVAPSGGAA